MTDADAAADAFDVLSDPSRVAILRTLADSTQTYDGGTVGFAELRRSVGFEDAGRFNYHLGKLRDRFVVKRDDGYAPTIAGLKALESAEAGLFTGVPESCSGRLDYGCPHCDEPLTGTYDDHRIIVACDEHGTVFDAPASPHPEHAGDVATILRVAVSEMWQKTTVLADGRCPTCNAPIPTLTFDTSRDVVTADVDCEYCHSGNSFAAALLVFAHPVVVAFYYDHGIDIRHHLPRDHVDEWLGTGELVADDPATVEFTVTLGGNELPMRIDEALDVREV